MSIGKYSPQLRLGNYSAIPSANNCKLLVLLCSSENYMYVTQLKGTHGAKAWPVLWLVKLGLKGSVELKNRVQICIYLLSLSLLLLLLLLLLYHYHYYYYYCNCYCY